MYVAHEQNLLMGVLDPQIEESGTPTLIEASLMLVDASRGVFLLSPYFSQPHKPINPRSRPAGSKLYDIITNQGILEPTNPNTCAKRPPRKSQYNQAPNTTQNPNDIVDQHSTIAPLLPVLSTTTNKRKSYAILLPNKNPWDDN